MRAKFHFPTMLTTLIAIALSGLASNAQARCATQAAGDHLKANFVISGSEINMPVGAFLLVRKKNHIGAIRLTKVDPNSTEWLGSSSYESYFQDDDAVPLTAANTIRKSGDLTLQQSKGPGRGLWIYKPGVYIALIGKWKFAFDGPSMMAMSDLSWLTGDQADHGFEFAPTSACNVSEIDVHDKNLRWFHFNQDAHLTLPISDLPK